MESRARVTDEAALEAVRYDSTTGLVPVVVQHDQTGDVLMLAYADREALKRTFATGQAWFFSRSRKEYWCKGATSGNTQLVREVRIDCDGDAVLYRVLPAGPACHTGAVSCFYRSIVHQGRSPGAALDGDAADSPNNASANPAADAPAKPRMPTSTAHSEQSAARTDLGADGLAQALSALSGVIAARWRLRPVGSYTTYLFEQGVDKVAKKVGEEGVEVALAAKNALLTDSGRRELAAESADLLYHLLVLWQTCGVSPDDVAGVLADRAK